jgi:hypothetical protein
MRNLLRPESQDGAKGNSANRSTQRSARSVDSGQPEPRTDVAGEDTDDRDQDDRNVVRGID